MQIDFVGSPRPTLGVEWELALVNRTSRDLSNTADSVFDSLTNEFGITPGTRVHKEFLRNTVEIVTGICDDVGQATAEVVDTLNIIHRVSDQLGVDFFSAGTHPFAQWTDNMLTDKPHYVEIINRSQYWGRQMLIWGVHVHVGVSHPDKVFPIINALLMKYPHLLALSGSSPMWDGQDTGYASSRALLFQQLPTAGLPFQFDTWAEFERFAGDQVKTGIINTVGGLHWDIRPNPSLGTIEVRVCDGTPTVRELSAITALIHCLVVDLDRRLVSGEILPSMPPWLVQENKWRAARYGLDAEIIVDHLCRERLVTDDLNDELERLAPVARSLGCAQELAAVADIPKMGASYQRQRRASQHGGVLAVVDQLVTELRMRP
ncbi:glutamate--cysteine ligase [Hoyosella rhizosphaerae]|uniref:Putative glutamate--cysteine ligase 2 n=1 Tax=Hoyosella rhizosphaerae TaxID=1755582 RepID=A0A916U5N9_9ACTN|nr:glutamate--cysteine ligase [Hoyosella rhizosphaerae]MBN4927777.1 glutamate--cysteine ligase [Hoyosella rhizosphaerae]GGC61615.1 putative glutamate--cysteine ligase 2-1 [Hoyosella rhizosphaerae]